MAIRQYIGARYVTKIYENSLDPSSAEWESGVTYEPLTMVTYMNSSYLSKKEVPGNVGNPASNPSFWVVTGAYNGQILNLQNQIDAINNVDIPAIQNDIGNLQTTVTSLVNNETVPFERAKILIVTDSYGIVNGSIADVIANSGYDIDQVALGGAGFGTGTKLKTALDSYAGDKSEIDYIFVVAGANDLNSSASDIYSGMTDFMSSVTNDFTRARVFLGHFGVKMKDGATYDSVYYYMLGANSHNMTYMANSEFTLRNTYFLESDYLHPTAGGVSQIGAQIINFMRAGACNVYYDLLCNLTGDGTYFANSRMKMIRHNEIVRIVPVLTSETILNYNQGTDLTNLNTKTIGTLDYSLVSTGTGRYIELSGTAKKNSSDPFPIFLNVSISENTVKILPVAGDIPTNIYLGTLNGMVTD